MLHIITWAYPSPAMFKRSAPATLNKLSVHIFNGILTIATAMIDGDRIVITPDGDMAHSVSYGHNGEDVLMPLYYGARSDFHSLIMDILDPKYNDLEVPYKLYIGRYDVYCATPTSGDTAECEVVQRREPEYEPSIDLPPNSMTIMAYTDMASALELALHNRPVPITTLTIGVDKKGNIASISARLLDNVIHVIGLDDREILVIDSMGEKVSSVISILEYSDDKKTAMDVLVHGLMECPSCEMIFLGAIQVDLSRASKAIQKMIRSDQEYVLPAPQNMHI